MPGMTIRLQIEEEDGSERMLAVHLRKARATAPEWEFRAES